MGLWYRYPCRGESASVNATLTRARHAHAVRPLMSRSYVICGFKLFFSRPLVSAELCSSAMRRKRTGARFSLRLCFTRPRIEDKYFRFVKAERARVAFVETFPRLFNPPGRETNVIFDRQTPNSSLFALHACASLCVCSLDNACPSYVIHVHTRTVGRTQRSPLSRNVR